MSEDAGRFDAGGILIRVMEAPPVYDPGGPVAFIECLPENAGTEALTEAEVEAARRSIVLMIVQCPVEAKTQEALLMGKGYTFASSWYSGSPAASAARRSAAPSTRTATAADVPHILELGDRKREQYETFSPVFWKKASASPETFAPYMTGQVESERNIVLVFETHGQIRGCLVAQCGNPTDGFVDDFAVSDPVFDWPTVGVALLAEASHQAMVRGVRSLTIVTGHADFPKRAAVEKLGFTLGKNWLVKPLH